MGVAVIQEAEKKGILGVLYEARLALGKAEMKHGNKEDGRARLAEVERIERSGHLPSRQLWRYAQDPSGLKSFRMTPVWWIGPNWATTRASAAAATIREVMGRRLSQWRVQRASRFTTNQDKAGTREAVAA